MSIEATRAEDLARLVACGYDRFQVVNQYLNPYQIPPEPAREGVYTPFKHGHHTSGLFGRELPPENWTDFQTMMRKFLQWYDIHKTYGSITVGWLDVHACKAGEATSVA